MQKLYPTEHDSHLRDEHFAEWFEKRLWDSESWRKKSKIAKSNRDKGNDKAARHTGGSIGYDEYRARMRKVFDREPNFREIFLLTHLDKA